MRNADPNARVNIHQDDLTLNGNADPLAGGLALLHNKFLPLELNKDKSTTWTNSNGLSHNSNIVERTGMKRADAPIIFHPNFNLDDATNNTATTATLPLDSERPTLSQRNRENRTQHPFGQEDRFHQEIHDPHRERTSNPHSTSTTPRRSWF